MASLLHILLQNNDAELVHTMRASWRTTIVLFVIMAMLVALGVYIKNLSSRNKTASIIKKLKKGTADTGKIAADLFSTVSRLELLSLPSDEVLHGILQALINSQEKIYKFKVKHAERMANDRYLLVTNCHEKEVFIDKSHDRVDFFLFILKANRAENKLELYAGIYNDLESKLNREEFGRFFLEHLKTKADQ